MHAPVARVRSGTQSGMPLQRQSNLCALANCPSAAPGTPNPGVRYWIRRCPAASTDPAPPLDEASPLLGGLGEVRALMRACPWNLTPLGAPDTWPASLSAVVRVMLMLRFAMWMAWGPDLTFLCNDAYSAHPCRRSEARLG